MLRVDRDLLVFKDLASCIAPISLMLLSEISSTFSFIPTLLLRDLAISLVPSPYILLKKYMNTYRDQISSEV